MSMRNEIRELTDQYEQQKKHITADVIVEAAKDATRFPNLHKHIWEESQDVLVHEARLARAHRLLISIRITTEEGNTTRLLIHTPGLPGYRSYAHVSTTIDLATVKLRQLADDIGRSRARLKEFRAIVSSDVIDEIDALFEQAEQRAVEVIDRRALETAA